MNNLRALLLVGWIFLTYSCAKTDPEEIDLNGKSREITILAGEKWWGGAVVDGRKMPFGETDYTFDQNGNVGTNQAQPLFLSNNGRYIWCDSPLRIDISSNTITIESDEADIIFGEQGKSLKEAFLQVAGNHFPPSKKIPAPILFTSPQYNTWIELVYDQNEEDILKYAESIIANGFPAGVLMIDDNWQTDYGTWEFSADRFSDPKGMIERLHAMGFKVMLWVCPWVSGDSRVYRELASQEVLLFSDSLKNSPAMVKWWNGQSAMIDLSNPEGNQWFKDQLNNLVDKYGVDGFKLDGGDASFYKGLYGYEDIGPNEHCELYAKIGLDFPFNEYRACWKMAGQPLIQRLRDKGHNWEDVGALIPDMLVLGLMGHPFGCPDMIGGGEFGSFEEAIIDEELVVRATQVHALMPAMQFSVAPWRVLNETNLAICQRMAALHQSMGNEIIELAKESAITGEPIMRHMDYVFPGNGYAKINDQFLLGDSILVAPAIAKGQRERTIIFPDGKWEGDDGSMVAGPITMKVAVPLERLPWYRRLNE